MKQDNKSHYPWFKSLWRIVVFLLFLPFSLSLWIWHRPWQKNTRIGLIILLWGAIYAYYFSPVGYVARQAGINARTEQALLESAKPTVAPDQPMVPVPIATSSAVEQPLIIPTPQKGVPLGDCEVKGNMFKASKNDCEGLKGYWKSTQNPTPTPVPVPSPTPTQVNQTDNQNISPISNETISQKNAVQKAKSYLGYSAFSHDGLVAQLEYEQFSHTDAVYGADNSGANWNEQAAKKAKQYMEYSAFSRGSLIDQLKYDKFTQEQAGYGANTVGL